MQDSAVAIVSPSSAHSLQQRLREGIALGGIACLADLDGDGARGIRDSALPCPIVDEQYAHVSRPCEHGQHDAVEGRERPLGGVLDVGFGHPRHAEFCRRRSNRRELRDSGRQHGPHLRRRPRQQHEHAGRCRHELPGSRSGGGVDHLCSVENLGLREHRVPCTRIGMAGLHVSETLNDVAVCRKRDAECSRRSLTRDVVVGGSESARGHDERMHRHEPRK